MGLIAPLLLLLAWQGEASFGLLPVSFLPPPLAVLGALRAMRDEGALARDIGVTLARLATGFAAGAAAGTILGALTGASLLARRLLDPLIGGLRSVPSIAWVPLFILWFGIFETSKVLLIAVGVFFPVYLNLAAAIAGADGRLLEVGRVFGLGRAQRLLQVSLPASLPAYVTGLRGGLALGWMFVAAAELMGASSGLGFELSDGEQTGRPERVIVAILLFALLGRASDVLLVSFSRPFLRWQRK